MLASKRDIDTKLTITLERILFIILLHAIIPAIFIIIYLRLGQWETAKKTFENNLIQITQFAAHSFEKEFLKTKSLLLIMSELPGIKSHDKKQCETISSSILSAEQDKIYTRIGAADKNGQVYCNNVPLIKPVDVSTNDYFQSVKKTQRFVIGGYSVGEASGNKQIVTAYPIFNNNGEFDGMVGAAIDIKWLDTIASRVKLPPGYTITTIDQHGVIIARHPNSEKWIGMKTKDKTLGEKLLAQSETEGTFTTKGLDEVDRLYAFTSINNLGEGKIHIAIGVPQEVVKKLANQHTLRDILILVGVILSAVIICAIDLHYFLFKRKPTPQ